LFLTLTILHMKKTIIFLFPIAFSPFCNALNQSSSLSISNPHNHSNHDIKMHDFSYRVNIVPDHPIDIDNNPNIPYFLPSPLTTFNDGNTFNSLNPCLLLPPLLNYEKISSGSSFSENNISSTKEQQLTHNNNNNAYDFSQGNGLSTIAFFSLKDI